MEEKKAIVVDESKGAVVEESKVTTVVENVLESKFPQEVRDLIYAHAMRLPAAVIMTHSGAPRYGIETLKVCDNGEFSTMLNGLPLVSKQYRKESLNFAYTENSFDFVLDKIAVNEYEGYHYSTQEAIRRLEAIPADKLQGVSFRIGTQYTEILGDPERRRVWRDMKDIKKQFFPDATVKVYLRYSWLDFPPFKGAPDEFLADFELVLKDDETGDLAIKGLEEDMHRRFYTWRSEYPDVGNAQVAEVAKAFETFVETCAYDLAVMLE